jgi:hypothetical protein
MLGAFSERTKRKVGDEMEVPLNLLVIEANFLPDNIGTGESLFEFSGDITPEKLIKVPSGLAMIVFRLTTEPPIIQPILPEALFQTSPMQWLATAPDGSLGGSPKLTPDMFVFQRIGDKVVTLLDFNSNLIDEEVEKNHWFNLVVTYGGTTYGSDPVIVNEPPDPPVPDDGRRHRTTDRAARESPRPAVKSRTRGARTSAR